MAVRDSSQDALLFLLEVIYNILRRRASRVQSQSSLIPDAQDSTWSSDRGFDKGRLEMIGLRLDMALNLPQHLALDYSSFVAKSRSHRVFSSICLSTILKRHDDAANCPVTITCYSTATARVQITFHVVTIQPLTQERNDVGLALQHGCISELLPGALVRSRHRLDLAALSSTQAHTSSTTCRARHS